MKYAAETGSGAMIYILIFIKLCQAIQKFFLGGDKKTHRHHGDRISRLFFKNKESRLKKGLPLQGNRTNIPRLFSSAYTSFGMSTERT
jgi:hypothetical protein